MKYFKKIHKCKYYLYFKEVWRKKSEKVSIPLKKMSHFVNNILQNFFEIFIYYSIDINICQKNNFF